MPKTEIIECPKCHYEFPLNVDEVVRKQISKEYEEQKAKDRLVLEAQKAELSKKEEALKAEQKNNDKIIAEAVAQQKAALLKEEEKLKNLNLEAEQRISAQVREQVTAKERNLRQELKKEAESEQAQLLAAMKEQMDSQAKKLKEASKREVEFLKKNADLEEQKNNIQIESLKQLEAEKAKLRTDITKKVADEFELKHREDQKQIDDVRKLNAELKRKLEQGSQQTQGEALELSLEDQLKAKFIYDEILPVPKGINGADIIQKVRNADGECGQIVWEAKNTKAWSQGWIQKLKADQRELHADIAIIVSEALPEEVKSVAPIEGVWVCSRHFALPLAALIRDKLEAIARERKLAIGKNEKIELLYQYLTGNQFRQRIEAIVENFAAMQEDLAKEKRYFKKKWAATEKRLEEVLDNTAGMYGELEGIAALPKIPALELEYKLDEEE